MLACVIGATWCAFIASLATYQLAPAPYLWELSNTTFVKWASLDLDSCLCYFIGALAIY